MRMSDVRSSVSTGMTGGDGELPPPPRPLPDAVAQIAAGLLVAPEYADAAGLPVIAGYELLAPLGRAWAPPRISFNATIRPLFTCRAW
jgi:hypothetical protein